MKKSSLVVSDWTENLSSLGSSSSSSEEEEEEEEILPTQTTTPSQTPEKHTRKRLSVKTGDMSSPPLPEKEERTTKIISVQFFSTDEEEIASMEDGNGNSAFGEGEERRRRDRSFRKREREIVRRI